MFQYTVNVLRINGIALVISGMMGKVFILRVEVSQTGYGFWHHYVL